MATYTSTHLDPRGDVAATANTSPDHRPGHHGARPYDPALGRFVTVDPAETGG